jgi:hypothetical protein
VTADVRALIRTMSATNPLSRAPGFTALLKLEIVVGQSSVAKYMVRRRQPSSRT